MVDSSSISRRIGPPDEHSFDSLKAAGIQLAQELSGDAWTDYNVHDPGVTILEQLCYALTDLIYRTEFNTPDYLTGEDGEIDFEEQALYRPESILPSEPITLNDYRKLFFDGVPEIDNVWVVPVTDDGQPQGLYRVYVQLGEDAEALGDSGRDQVIEKIRDLYVINRNLCEDLQEVIPVENRHYTLHGSLEIDGEREPADILSEIYFKATQFVASGIAFIPFDEILTSGKDLDEIFTGPRTRHVYIDESNLDQTRESVSISEIIGILNEIEGIRNINDLCFKDDEGVETDSIPYDPLNFVPHLQFPESSQNIGVKLYKSEREYRISLREIRGEFDRLNSEYQALRQASQDFGEVSKLPQGEYRNLDRYYSIQNHFPDVYGINRYGVPQSAPPRRKAQARQLKAYLLFFEQIMADFLENLQSIPKLFSLDDQLRQSYFHQFLGDRSVPNVEELYQGEPAQVDAQISQIIRLYDNFVGRRSRVLDYLLAIYGEKFTQNSLRRFNYYYTFEELENEMIRNKLNLLKHVGGLI